MNSQCCDGNQMYHTIRILDENDRSQQLDRHDQAPRQKRCLFEETQPGTPKSRTGVTPRFVVCLFTGAETALAADYNANHNRCTVPGSIKEHAERVGDVKPKCFKPLNSMLPQQLP